MYIYTIIMYMKYIHNLIFYVHNYKYNLHLTRLYISEDLFFLNLLTVFARHIIIVTE